MPSYLHRTVLRICICSLVFIVLPHGGASSYAVGILYGDPGWFYAYDGNEAFYNDPDGPNPDYLNGNDMNDPGGQSDRPALVDPTVLDPGCDPSKSVTDPDGCGSAEWFHKSQNWDGTAPGDPLGGIPNGIDPVPPPAPGGVGAFTDSGDGTTFLRIQDPGNPVSYGFADKGSQVGPGKPKLEGSNRKIQFAHDMNVDASFSGDQAILDNGITIAFRTRLATLATGPLDDIFPENGGTLASTVPWPSDGLGYTVANEGRGMFHITQTGAGGQQQMAFSLVDQDTINFEALGITKTGLVMNNQANAAVANDVDTNTANDMTLNVVEIPDEDLVDWHEFWINIKALDAPVDGNTHEVTVYLDGDIDTPQVFQIILGPENEFGSGAHLGLGLSSGTAQGAYDIDYFAYAEGILDPITAAVEDNADFDGDGDVDGTDFLIWQRGFGSGTMHGQGDADGNNQVDAADLVIWENQFGASVSAAVAGVPEPSGALLAVVALWVGQFMRQRRN